jgi:hypothetical protein
MNTVMQKLRTELVESIQATLGISREIQGLKWKEGSQPEIQRLRSVKDEKGRRVNGNRSLKPYRRPETGPKRNALWTRKRELGYTTREYLLLWAMLRGKAYKTVEAKCKEENYPCIYGMSCILQKCFGDTPSPIGMDEINNWVKGEAAPKLVEVAA